MKIKNIILVFTGLLVLFSSCATLRLEKRNYESGICAGPSPKRIPSSLQCAKKSGIVLSEMKNKTIDPATPPTILTRECRQSPEVSRPEKKNPIPAQYATPASAEKRSRASVPPGDEQEIADNKKWTLVFALTTYILLFFCLFMWAISVPVFVVLVCLMVAGSVASLVFAKRLKGTHEKKEKYPGRGSVILARLIGILGIVFTFFTIVIALGSAAG